MERRSVCCHYLNHNKQTIKQTMPNPTDLQIFYERFRKQQAVCQYPIHDSQIKPVLTYINGKFKLTNANNDKFHEKVLQFEKERDEQEEKIQKLQETVRKQEDEQEEKIQKLQETVRKQEEKIKLFCSLVRLFRFVFLFCLSCLVYRLLEE